MNDLSLSPSELASLERGLPSLAEWSTELLVPFAANRLKDASVLWLNRRWFLERGFDIDDRLLRQRIEAWLCGTFAFAVPREEDSPFAYTAQVRTLYADRYGGSSSINRHGGSGRAATVGRFHVKGVGLTPLAGTDCDWVHSHGCMSVEEAIREVIYGEIVAAEFPLGAVPIIAIIDAGLCYSRPKPEIANEALMRRALVVRPAFVRPAHAERAPRFLTSQTDYVNSQVADTKRCREVVANWLDRTGTDGVRSKCNIEELIAQVALQAAFSQAHRLFIGGLFSSNLTIDGALVDFGGMRPQRNWANARMTQYNPGFGDEMCYLHGLVSSLVFHFKKFGGPITSGLSVEALLSDAQGRLEQAFARECINLFGLDESDSESEALAVAGLLRHYFIAQQKLRINYATRHTAPAHWIHEVLSSDEGWHDDTLPERALCKAIDAALQKRAGPGQATGRLRRHAWITAMRCLKPRLALERDLLQNETFTVISVDGAGSRPDVLTVEAWIRHMVGEGRRHWPHLPKHLTVVGQVCRDGCSALLCEDSSNGDEVIWLEGIRADVQCWLFDTCVPPRTLQSLVLHKSPGRWSTRVPGRLLERVSMRLDLPACAMRIPPFQATYVAPGHFFANEAQDATILRSVPSWAVPQALHEEPEEGAGRAR